MKTFLDRFTDCLKIEISIGRKLRGKSMAAISCSSEHIETEGFFIPFEKSAGYLGMNYLGGAHTWVDSVSLSLEVCDIIEIFASELKQNMA